MAVHASVGALAGNAVSSPSLAFAMGFVSHFFLDMIPHGDLHMYDNYKRGDRVRTAVLYVVADAVVTIVIVSLLFIRQDYFAALPVAMGVIGGLLPDLLAGSVELWKPKRRTFLARKMTWFHGFHMKMHCAILKHSKRFDRDIPFRYGLMLQGVVLTCLVFIIL